MQGPSISLRHPGGKYIEEEEEVRRENSLMPQMRFEPTPLVLKVGFHPLMLKAWFMVVYSESQIPIVSDFQ